MLLEPKEMPDLSLAHLMKLSVNDLESVLPEWRDAHELDFMHFAENDGDVVFNLWRLLPRTDLHKGQESVELGSQCADELLRFSHEHNSAMLLGMVAAELLRRPGMQGCLIREGFFARLIAAAFRGALN
jgi:hypothetical protein